MNRRRFASLLALSVATPVVVARAQDLDPTPPPDRQAPVFSAVRYTGSDPDATIRSIEVRTSMWPTSQAAGALAGSLTANAGTPLPDGEFYHSEVESWSPDLTTDAAEVTGRCWHTTVGVAAYQTSWAQIVVWQETSVTVALVSGGTATTVQNMATDMMQITLDWIPVPCGPDDPLPKPDEVPEGMTLEFRVTNHEARNDNGTPIADPWLSECVQPVVG